MGGFAGAVAVGGAAVGSARNEASAQSPQDDRYRAWQVEVVGFEAELIEVVSTKHDVRLSARATGFPEGWEIAVGDAVMLVVDSGAPTIQPLVTYARADDPPIGFVHVDREEAGAWTVQGKTTRVIASTR